MSTVTVDTHYTGRPRVAAAYLLVEDDRVAFVEANTTPNVPRLLAALSEADRRPEDVEYVVVTHIHLDHAGGAGALMAACPNATLLAHPKAAPHAIDPSRIIRGATEVYGEETFEALYGEVVPVPEARVRILADGETLSFGSRTWHVLHTRGHANHHLCLHDEAADAVFTGDSFGVIYPDLQRHGPLALPSTTPTDFDPEAAHDSIERILATGVGRVFPTHFGEQTALRALADQLHARLDAHAVLVDRADALDLHGEVLDRFCLDGVRTIIAAALDEVGLGGEARAAELADLDARLNAQGLAFALAKRRYKRSRA